jgi:prepilin-type N-terminal cleavage/methylation domain-containing protein
MMPGLTKKTTSKGFTLVEIMISLAILGILAAISIPNYRLYKDKAEKASMLTTLKYLMDGQDYYFLENGAFFRVNIPKETAIEIPELAYSFLESNRNRYRITVTNNRNRNRYVIRAFCDFDSNGNGRDDRFTATTDIRRGEVRKNREIVQLR